MSLNIKCNIREKYPFVNTYNYLQAQQKQISVFVRMICFGTIENNKDCFLI